MIDIELDEATRKKQEARLQGVPRGMKRALYLAVHDTAKNVRTDLSKQLRTRINIKKSEIDPNIKIKRGTPADPHAVVKLAKKKRIGLRDFGAKVFKKGVSYKIDKRGARKKIPGAFVIDMYNQHIFIRVGTPVKGQRQKITKLHGLSAFGAAVKTDTEVEVRNQAKFTLRYNVERRVRFLLLKQAGTI